MSHCHKRYRSEEISPLAGKGNFYMINLTKKLCNIWAKKSELAVTQGGPDFGHCIQGALCICVSTKAGPAVFTIVHVCTYVHVYEQLYRARPAVVACATDCWALGSRAPGRIRHPQAPQAGSLNIARASTTSDSIALHKHCIYSAYKHIPQGTYGLSLQFLWTSCIKTCVWWSRLNIHLYVAIRMCRVCNYSCPQ